ncbi:MAG: hypothetical protein QOE62_239, partial [Actinomycetota bacterium]|nr:hypothetical protein [Actinomycetota bacterium]
YILLGADGGIFSFGDAHFYGSTGGVKLNARVLDLAVTQSGHGYWFVAADGGVFSFGDARFHGSTGGIHLAAPVMSIASSGDGRGYWLVASDGGIFAFDVPYEGSLPSTRTGPDGSYPATIRMRAVSTNDGYYLLGANGSVSAFGSAPYLGSQLRASVDLMVAPPAAAAVSPGSPLTELRHIRDELDHYITNPVPTSGRIRLIQLRGVRDELNRYITKVGSAPRATNLAQLRAIRDQLNRYLNAQPG